MKFIENYRFLTILGSSIEPEKPSVKSASTPYPPSKVNFIEVLLIRDPILAVAPFFIKIYNIIKWYRGPNLGIKMVLKNEFFCLVSV
jgi:hypothetical protein